MLYVKTFSDIDECIDDGVCSLKQNTECMNSIGSYDCVCKPGYNETEGGNCEGMLYLFV